MAVLSSSRFNTKEATDWGISKFLEEYQGDIIEELTEVTEEVAKEAVQKLKKTSPKGATGKYAKGWAYQLDKKRLSAGATIYGKDGTYQLAHLLEHGHAKVGGGRTSPQEHIAPVEEWAVSEIIERTIARLEGV